jgi:hypothetical protein
MLQKFLLCHKLHLWSHEDVSGIIDSKRKHLGLKEMVLHHVQGWPSNGKLQNYNIMSGKTLRDIGKVLQLVKTVSGE